MRERAGPGWPQSAGRRAGGTALAGLLLLGACSTATAPYRLSTEVPPGLCRVGPDGGPPLADRGIGGTGAPTAIAERGIGGTGIIAIITGFASICLAGVEVGLGPDVPMTLDGQAIPPAALRAGQLAIVDAEGSGSELAARSVAVRQEVSGPVESVSTSGWLRVAGQLVQILPTTLGEQRLVVGQWVAVSGLRGPDGVVQATRLDRREPGDVLVRGRIALADGAPYIGGLRLRTNDPLELGRFVTARGRYRAGVLEAAQLAPDPLATDPAAAFPPTTGRILVESYAIGGQEGLRLGQGPLLPGVADAGASAPLRAVVEFRREPGGAFRPTSIRPTGPALEPTARTAPVGAGPMAGPGGGPGMGPGSASQPAPVPRAMLQGGGAQGGRASPWAAPQSGGGAAGPGRLSDPGSTGVLPPMGGGPPSGAGGRGGPR